MGIRILETYAGDVFPIAEWLPADSISAAGVASVPIRWLSGPSEVLPISMRTGGGYSRQVVTGPAMNVDIKTDLIDYIVSQIEIDEAGMLAVLGAANRAAVDAYAALQTFGLIDTGTQQLHVDFGIVEASYEKAYPDGENRKTIDLKALAVIDRLLSRTALKTKYNDTPNTNGLTWPEFAAAYSVNLDDYANDKNDAIEAARVYIETYY